MSADPSPSPTPFHPFLAPDPTPILASANDLSDISAMKPNGWLTDACIRTLIHTYRSPSPIPHITFTPPISTPTSLINLVDPDWITAWRYKNYEIPSQIPYFLSHPGPVPLQGLAIPLNIGNSHWTTIYINLSARGAVLFDSLRSPSATALAREVCDAFFCVFENFFFQGGETEFRFEVDTQCAQQQDGSSCGIYTARNCLDLLEHRRPSGVRLTEVEIANARRNGERVMREKLEAQVG